MSTLATLDALDSAECAATAPSSFLVKRIPDAQKAQPAVEYTINQQGVILNAKFASPHAADAARIGRFIAEHNAAMAELRQNSKLSDLR